MKKNKIIRIIARLNIGGPAQHVVFLSEALDKNNFETILVTGEIEDSEGDMSYLASERNLNVTNVPGFRRKLDFVGDIKVFWKVFKIIAKEKPDIIHTHTAKAGTLGRVAGIIYNIFAKNKAILIHTFHGHVLSGYFGTLKSSIFVYIERFLAHFTNKIIAVSASVYQDLTRLKIGNRTKIVIIPLGLELDSFLAINSMKDISKTPEYFKVGIIGRLVPIKNHRLFLESARLYIDNKLHLPIKFVIIGDGELKNELENYAKELNLNDVIEFRGWLKDLDKVYSKLDIVCLTSLNEGTPVSLIEAMAASKPVIATNVGGVKELLSNNPPSLNQTSNLQICERGILTKSCNINAFTEGLRILAEDKCLRNKMGQNGREFAKERFSKERLTFDIKNLYISLIERRK